VGAEPVISREDFERRESIYVLWNCNAAIGQTEGEKNPDWIWETIGGMV
jgi:hypothetical protein